MFGYILCALKKFKELKKHEAAKIHSVYKDNKRVPTQLSKVVGDASTPLDVDSNLDIHEFPFAKELKDATDCHWVVAYVIPPYWKQYLREISIEQLCDIHDKAYLRQAVLDNVLNGRTRKLIYALHKARASCDTIREREIQKYKAYAELEKKCNEALQDLDKTPLVSDMRAEIETLQSRVNDLHNEYSRLILEEKNLINYEQTLSTLYAKVEGLESEGKRLRASEVHILQDVDSLRQDRAALVARVISDQAMKLIRSDEMGVLIARLVKASIIHGRCAAFEEYDRAGNDLADASYPFLAELTDDPYASVEQLLSKKPQSLQSNIFLQRLRRDAVIKGEFEKIKDVKVEDVSLACDTSLEVFNNKVNRLNEMNDDLFTYEVKVANISCVTTHSGKEAETS
ncbi:hypothetical protein Tco_1100639 [Tanacetum coccineum]